MSVADPRIFSAFQMYVPPFFLFTLYIVSVPFNSSFLSFGKVLTALDHLMVGRG